MDQKTSFEELLNEHRIAVERYVSFDIIIGERKFETIMFINPQTNGVLCENYVDTNGRLVLMRWYESMESIEQTEYYDDEFRSDIANNPSLTVNDMRYLLIEDRISEYAL